jgi:prophage tail gpP-like protein
MAGDKVELLIGGTIYAGWKGVSVRRSLDYFADSFMLELTDSQAGSARTIKLGSPCRVLVGGEKLITGFIDRIGSGYDGNSRRLSVAGRSRTADLVDCSLPADQVGGAQKNNRTLLELAGSVCGLLGIAVSSTVAGLPPRLIANIEIEQSFYEFLECQARLDGVMLVSDPDGNLVITRASDERVGTALILGDNIETADGELSDRDRFSHYYVAAQGAETDDSWGESAAHVTGLAEDPRVRYRPTSILLTSGTQAEAKRYADWQRNVRYGRSRQATYTVSGWRHRDGLWRPNTRVLVKDDWLGFTGPDGKGEWLMIGSVEFIFDDGGRRTLLTVMPAEAFDLIPLPAKAKKDEEGVW